MLLFFVSLHGQEAENSVACMGFLQSFNLVWYLGPAKRPFGGFHTVQNHKVATQEPTSV